MKGNVDEVRTLCVWHITHSFPVKTYYYIILITKLL